MNSRNILVADSDQSFIDAISSIITGEGYQVLRAYSGMDALELVKQQTCCCIFLDLLIPKVDGARVCRYLKEDHYFSHIPVVIISGAIAESVAYLDDIGADFYIAKGPLEKMRGHILTVLQYLEGVRMPLEEAPVLGIDTLLPRAVTRNLLQYQRHYETILNTMGEGVIELDAEFKMVRVNPAAEMIFNLPARMVIGKRLDVLFEGDEEVPQILSKMSSASNRSSEKMTLNYQDKVLRVALTPLVEHSRSEGWLLIVQDITDLYKKIEELTRANSELSKTQAQLLQAAKLSAIGQLAANITHEINTPLTSILGYVSLLLKDMDEHDLRKKDLVVVQDEALRARNIIRGLLNFVHQGEVHLQELEVMKLLQETLLLVTHRAQSRKITVIERYSEKPLYIRVDANQMKQVFINLINNAIDAMPQGGTLTITTSCDEKHAFITFRDTGIGIAPERMAEIFDPFFTTKPRSEGTGLGLSLSLKIVREFSGSIEVESEIGKGSSFTVKLPFYSSSTIQVV